MILVSLENVTKYAHVVARLPQRVHFSCENETKIVKITYSVLLLLLWLRIFGTAGGQIFGFRNSAAAAPEAATSCHTVLFSNNKTLLKMSELQLKTGYAVVSETKVKTIAMVKTCSNFLKVVKAHFISFNRIS